MKRTILISMIMLLAVCGLFAAQKAAPINYDVSDYPASNQNEQDVSREPGWIEGLITLVGGTGDVQNVVVTCSSGAETNPDADGNYSFELDPGTYSVTAELAGYVSGLVENVVVEDGATTEGVDLALVYSPSTFDPPTNLAVDPETALFTWDAPGGGGEMFELIQHSNLPDNAYYQSYDYGYGVVYDLSGYTDVTVEQLDYRHSSWGIYGTWDYNIHIVDWDTFTELEVVEGLQTTGDDIWEEGIDLGSVSESGLVGIFIEPLSNDPTDAYPCVDADNVLDGMSYFGNLSDYSAFEASGVGDFLMDLWIMGTETRGLVKAQRYSIEQNTTNARKRTQLVDFVSTQQTVLTRDFTGCDVYLDDVFQDFTSNTEWQFDTASLVVGQIYSACLVAIYDDPGQSDMVCVDFTYEGSNNAAAIIPLVNELNGNFPNPFNPVTDIAYSLSEAGNVSIEIFNTKGQLVKTLVNEYQQTGSHNVIWNGTDDSSKAVSSGIYYYRMKTGDRYTSTKKMILLK